MDLIWGHISPEWVSHPELKNIGLTFWHFRKTSFWFSRHVREEQPTRDNDKIGQPERRNGRKHRHLICLMVNITPPLESLAVVKKAGCWEDHWVWSVSRGYRVQEEQTTGKQYHLKIGDKEIVRNVGWTVLTIVNFMRLKISGLLYY